MLSRTACAPARRTERLEAPPLLSRRRRSDCRDELRRSRPFIQCNQADTCHYDTSPIPSYSGIVESTGPVDSNAHYGDLIGLGDDRVQCYRANAPGCTVYKAPCQYETDQKMFINVPGKPEYHYITNRVKMGMGSNWVWSYRAGQQDQRGY